MAVFKFVISDKDKTYQVEKDQKDCPILNKKIGDTFSADFLGLDDYELQIKGGSDKDGFPMRKDLEGIVRKSYVMTNGIGFHTDKEGMRKRKMMRGNTISTDVVQVNCKVIKNGPKNLSDVLGKKEEVKKE